MTKNGGDKPGREPEILARSQDSHWPLADESPTRFAQRVLARPMREMAPGGAQASVLFTSDARLRSLNRQYRKIDRPTDVLAFALNEGADQPGESASALGDIVISIQAAQRQAAERGVKVRDELALLLLHGFLHLIGFDHDNDAAAQEMFETQDRWLQRLGFAPGPGWEGESPEN